VERIILSVNYSGIELRKELDSLALFASKVMPWFQD
jgi:hypothetical protein